MQAQLATLEERKEELMQTLASLKKARDEADGKMQSRYDTQKEDLAQEVAMYESMIADLDRLIEQLKNLQSSPQSPEVAVGRKVTIEFDDGDTEEFLLLSSQGGVELGDYRTLSTASPVGSAILGAHVGQTINVRLSKKNASIRIVAVN